MRWCISYRADPRAREIADRHYNRQKIGAPQFVPPGRCVVLVIPQVAFWITSWPFAEYVKHAWAGAWVCSAFRNERPDLHRSSDLIREALAATLAVWSTPPSLGMITFWTTRVGPIFQLGMITFVDEDKTKPKRHPGYCYRMAGFEPAAPTHTKAGLVALQLLPSGMPEPAAALPTNWYEVVSGNISP